VVKIKRVPGGFNWMKANEKENKKNKKQPPSKPAIY
jgi:hypothetical protein